nr:hypothetical protein [uncultured Carboxylicivirga sp.]
MTFKKQKQAIWLMISKGFTFLALDEILLIHENIDKWIHAFFQITQTHLTDRIDDFIILLYGIVDGLLMIKNRRLFLNNKPGLALAITGFILMF